MIFLSRKLCPRTVIGMVIGAVGMGILLAVLVPIWGWLLVAGAALVYIGWYVAECFRR